MGENGMLSQLNSPPLYLICGLIILFVAIVCVIFLVRAYRAGKKAGMDPAVLKRAIVSSASFSILPSVGILLGVIALSGSLGTPWPWLRLSVIGALHYETQVAEAAAEQVGIGRLSGSTMTPEAFVTIALLMSICIMWGMVLSVLFNKSYLKKIRRRGRDEKKNAGREGFGDMAITAMFTGLVSVYLGSYIGGFVSGRGHLTFEGDFTPVLVCLVSAAVMAFFTWLSAKKGMKWLEGFSIAGSMLIGMLSAMVF